MASWLLLSTLDWAVHVQTWPGALSCVVGQDTLLSQPLSMGMGTVNFSVGSNPSIDKRPILQPSSWHILVVKYWLYKWHIKGV